MKRTLPVFLCTALITTSALASPKIPEVTISATTHTAVEPSVQSYHKIFTHHEVSYNAYKKAILAYNKTDIKNPDRLILVDYSKSSSKERFYVIDMKTKKVEYSTYVAHAKSSGWRYASHFSNKVNSSESAIGRFKTQPTTYYGKNGTSLRIIGLDKGLNDNTFKRDIVIHGSFYVGEKWMRKHDGFQGRSLGCFAIPHSVYMDIIPKITNGVVMYVYKS